MEFLAVVVGVALVLLVLADLLNTLISTTRSSGRFWLTRILYMQTWRLVRMLGRLIRDDQRRERFYSWFGPISVIAMLVTWVSQQIIGFGLIWWGLGGVSGAEDLADSMYYSGVVYFTLGFGEIVPAGSIPRIGALNEAFSGVLTTVPRTASRRRTSFCLVPPTVTSSRSRTSSKSGRPGLPRCSKLTRHSRCWRWFVLSTPANTGLQRWALSPTRHCTWKCVRAPRGRRRTG